MPKKRKNSGKNRANRGSVNFVRCDVSGRAVPKDKAVKRFVVRNLVDASGKRDLEAASVYKDYRLPKMYYKAHYCISAAIHQRVVRCRNAENRKKREPPREVLKRWHQQKKREREQEMRRLDQRNSGRRRGGATVARGGGAFRGRGRGRGGFGGRGGRGGGRGGRGGGRGGSAGGRR